MASDFLQIKIDDRFSQALANAPRNVQVAINAVIQETGEKVFQRIRFRTPRDRGTLAAGWGRRSQEGSVVIFNTVPYVNVLEYGGYPVIPASRNRTLSGGLVRGRAVLGGGYPPRARTVRAPGGEPSMLAGSNVSRQAPTGMVRVTLIEIQPEYIFNLEEALDRALRDAT